MIWPQSGIPCRVSAFWIALAAYALIAGCARPDGVACVALALVCYGAAYCISVMGAYACEEETMATEQEQQHVADVIKTLPMYLREPFVMAWVLRKPLAKIRAELHLSHEELDRRLAKALATCRRRLQER